tara:strand:+ start:947 stop:1435 length:489 start_codon:yes stop_codon:yes gene_type:complete
MKKIITIIIFFIPFFTFSQGGEKKTIDWISLEKAEKFAKKYNKNMLLFFYRPGCDYCDKMKKETLTDPQIIQKINQNFLPVMLNGKGKEPIIYNKKTYVNDHPNPKDAPWRHNLYFELVDPVRGNYYWPDVVIINSQYKKLTQFPGFQSKEQLIRNLNRFIK